MFLNIDTYIHVFYHQVETKKLQKQLDHLKEKLDLSQEQSKDNITLTVENQRLSKALTTSQNALSRVAELESELEDKVCTLFELSVSNAAVKYFYYKVSLKINSLNKIFIVEKHLWLDIMTWGRVSIRLH